MALKVKAVERLLKFDKNDPGSYRYVLKPELYTSLDQKKVIREAALRSQPKNIEMFEAIDFNFQTYLYCRRYFRLHTEQHRIIVSFLLSYPVWQPI